MVRNVCPAKIIIAVLSLILLITAMALVLVLDSGHLHTTLRPFDLDDVTLSYPVLPDSISGYVNVVVSFLIDIVLVVVWVFLLDKSCRKMKLVLSVFMVFYSTALVNLITNIVKHYMGGLRPHFIAACELDESMVTQIRATGNSWVDLDATKTICTADGTQNYRWSFPSGHTSQACFAMMLATLIVNSWDTIWTRYPFTLPIKGTVQFLFLCYANLVAVSRIVDYHHHWYDVLAGAVLGTILALVTHYWFLLPIMEMTDDECRKENATTSLDREGSEVA